MSKIEKSYEYKSIQVPKLKESMKMGAKRHYDEYYPRYWNHGCEIVHNIRIVARKMIEKGVGKPYGEIYSKFIKRYPESKYYISRDPKDIFKENFSSRVLWNNVYEGDFYLDENYIIRKRLREPNIINDLKGIKFKWNNNKYYKTEDLYLILNLIFSDESTIITEKEYKYDEVLYIIEKIRNSYNDIHKYLSETSKKLLSLICKNLNIIHDKNDKYFNDQLFIPIEFKQIDYITVSDYIKRYYIQKQNKKRIKKYRKWKTSYEGELYLRTYKLKQKLRQQEENDINIERLGFDKLTSFRGIEYHGQKRKRKNSL